MSRFLRIPKYRLHKQSGQAVVTLADGLGRRRDVLLGKHSTSESRTEYARVIAEWEANNRHQLPVGREAVSLSIGELLLAYWRWAEKTYRDGAGTPTRELDNLKDALRPLRQLYGDTEAAKFGPLALRTVRENMIAAGLCRRTINTRIGRLKRVFRWAVSYELLPAAVYEALRTIPGLQRGRGEARDTDPIMPVAEAVVAATLPFMLPPVRAMVELQLLTGMRPGEVRIMRACDLDVTGDTWIYRPSKHKNRNRGIDRVIFLGPQAQAIIRPFLKTDLQAPLFSPADAMESQRILARQNRKTKVQPSQQNRSKRKPKRPPGNCYGRNSYRKAVNRACVRAGVPEWNPLQLRHTAATLLRAKYGVEAAKVILGHSRVETTQIYAERDLNKAEQIMQEIG